MVALGPMDAPLWGCTAANGSLSISTSSILGALNAEKASSSRSSSCSILSSSRDWSNRLSQVCSIERPAKSKVAASVVAKREESNMMPPPASGRGERERSKESSSLEDGESNNAFFLAAGESRVIIFN